MSGEREMARPVLRTRWMWGRGESPPRVIEVTRVWWDGEKWMGTARMISGPPLAVGERARLYGHGAEDSLLRHGVPRPDELTPGW